MRSRFRAEAEYTPPFLLPKVTSYELHGPNVIPARRFRAMSKGATEAETPRASNDPARWVDEHGDVLYRYALARVRRPEVAQDLVQETFLAAIRSQDRFGGQSSVRSWLCGILKHKLADYYRKLGRETPFTDLEFLKDECADRFVPEGFWVHMTGPKEWRPDPDEVMHRDDFWK